MQTCNYNNTANNNNNYKTNDNKTLKSDDSRRVGLRRTTAPSARVREQRRQRGMRDTMMLFIREPCTLDCI